jgi:hypothetical protein
MRLAEFAAGFGSSCSETAASLVRPGPPVREMNEMTARAGSLSAEPLVVGKYSS